MDGPLRGEDVLVVLQDLLEVIVQAGAEASIMDELAGVDHVHADDSHEVGDDDAGRAPVARLAEHQDTAAPELSLVNHHCSVLRHLLHLVGAVLALAPIHALQGLAAVHAQHVVVDLADRRRERADQLVGSRHVDVLRVDSQLFRHLVERKQAPLGHLGVPRHHEHGDSVVTQPLLVSRDADGAKVEVVEYGLGGAASLVGPVHAGVVGDLLFVLGDDLQVFEAERGWIDVDIAGDDSKRLARKVGFRHRDGNGGRGGGPRGVRSRRYDGTP